jgi:hypothetical protein
MLIKTSMVFRRRPAKLISSGGRPPRDLAGLPFPKALIAFPDASADQEKVF